MDGNVDLGAQAEEVVNDLVARGVYETREDVLRAGVELVAARAARLAEFDAALSESIAEADAGLTIDADEVFDELMARYSSSLALPDESPLLAARPAGTWRDRRLDCPG